MKNISYKTALLLCSLPGSYYTASKLDLPIRTCKKYGVKIKVSKAFQRTSVIVVENNLIPKGKSFKDQIKKAIQLRRQIEVCFNVKKKINEFTTKPESELHLSVYTYTQYFSRYIKTDEDKKLWATYQNVLLSGGL